MNLHNRLNLIPRNNWDYGLPALFTSLASIHAVNAPAVDSFFLQSPIYTITGRTSLYAILKALDLPTGSQVGVPLYCCSVVFNAICQAGLTPRFIDSNLDDANISIPDLQRKRSVLAAIVPVHMFGNPCDMDAINEIACGIPVIGDCAQSVYSTYKGTLTGFLSTASFFTFRCGKYISAGEGGAIFCRDAELREKVARVVETFEDWSVPQMAIQALSTFTKAALYNRPWYGPIGNPVGMALDKKYNLTAKDGFETGKIASTHLALINERIGRYQEKINIQRKHARMLLESLNPGPFCLPSENPGCESNWYQFALRFEGSAHRDSMAAFLFQRGIDTACYLDGIDEEAADLYGYQGGCPNAESLSRTILLIPIHYNLRDFDIQHIARSINEGSRSL